MLTDDIQPEVAAGSYDTSWIAGKDGG